MSSDDIVVHVQHSCFAAIPLIFGIRRWLLGNEFREAFQTEDFDLVLIIGPTIIIIASILNCFSSYFLDKRRLSSLLTTILYFIIYLTIWSFQIKAFVFYRRNLNDLEITSFPPANEFEENIFFVVLGSFVNCCQDEFVDGTNLTCAELDPVLPCVPEEDEELFRDVQEGMGGDRSTLCNTLRSNNGRNEKRFRGFGGIFKACDDGIEIYAEDALSLFRRNLFMTTIIVFLYATVGLLICIYSLVNQISSIRKEDLLPERNKWVENKREVDDDW